MLSTVIDWLFPVTCVGCGASKTYCCNKCLGKLPGARSAPGRGIITLLDYHNRKVKKLIWLLKYRGARSVAPVLASALYDRVLDEIAEMEMFTPSQDTWLVVPIPLSGKKRRRRGFNQVEEIAKYMLRQNSRNFEAGFNILRRENKKNDRAQMSIKHREERWRNVANAFCIGDARAVRDRNILLLDDVSTTGATLCEARSVLVAAGARNVLAVAIAQG